MLEYNGFEVFCDGGGSIRVRDNEFAVSVDPSPEAPGREAAIVLITSVDREDLDMDKLKQVCGRGTCVVLPEQLRGMNVPCPDVEFLRPGEAVDIYSVEISAMKSGRGLAYRFDMRGTCFFVSGNTEELAEPMEFENLVDLALFSASDSVDLDQAVRNAVKIKPEVVVPYLHGERGLDGFSAELEDRNIECRFD